MYGRMKIPTKLIKMCKTCVQNKRRVVRLEGALSSFLENKTGLKQGDALPPILFNLVLQEVIQSIKIVPNGVKIGKKQLNILPYADGIALNCDNRRCLCVFHSTKCLLLFGGRHLEHFVPTGTAGISIKTRSI